MLTFVEGFTGFSLSNLSKEFGKADEKKGLKSNSNNSVCNKYFKSTDLWAD